MISGTSARQTQSWEWPDRRGLSSGSIWKHLLHSCLADDAGCRLGHQLGCQLGHFHWAPCGLSTNDLGCLTAWQLSSKSEHPVEARQEHTAFSYASLWSHVATVLPYFGQGNHNGPSRFRSGETQTPLTQGKECQGHTGGRACGQEILLQPTLENALSCTFCV